MFPVLVILFLSSTFQIGRTLIFLEHPKSQNVIIGSNVTFSCVVEDATNVDWYAFYSNNTYKATLAQGEEGVINTVMTNVQPSNGIATTLTLFATESWNGTIIRCYADQGHGYLSHPAYLMVYTSLRPLPPSQLQITTDTSSNLFVSWIPTLLWDDYGHIDYYNMSVARKGSSYLLLSILVNSTNLTLNYSDLPYPPCSEFEFSISAVSREYGESSRSVIIGGFDSDIDTISQELSVTTNLYFRSNGFPIVDAIIQLPPSVCSYQYITINSSVLTDSGQGTGLIHSDFFTSRGPKNFTSSVKHGLLKDRNYTLKVTIASSGGSSYRSTFINFDTKFLVQLPTLTCSKSPTVDKVTLYYKIAVGACLAFAIVVCLAFVGAVVSLYVHNKRKAKKLKINDSISRVCNAMVHNPIYNGPVYESVQTQFETLTKQGTSTSNTSACNSQPSTPTSSEKSIRYVDPPSSAHQASKIRSKSFLSHPSAPESDTDNIPRCTSVSIPVIKKIPKQRNKLHLTLTLTGTDSAVAIEAHDHNAQNCTAKTISAVNPVVLRDVDDNYTVMSPAAGRRTLVDMDEWSELSPEDTEKYKE